MAQLRERINFLIIFHVPTKCNVIPQIYSARRISCPLTRLLGYAAVVVVVGDALVLILTYVYTNYMHIIICGIIFALLRSAPNTLGNNKMEDDSSTHTARGIGIRIVSSFAE